MTIEQDPPPPEPVAGFVTKLNDANSRATIEGQIGNQWRDIELAFDDRFRSVPATAWDERRPAFVEGQLKRGGRRWVFSTVSHIDTLPEDLDDM